MKNRFLSVVPLVGGLFYLVQQFNAPAAVHYVNAGNPTPALPYTSWATAATNIQDAVDAVATGDEVLVTNGVYQTGGRTVYGILTNRVVVDKAITVRSVNGPAVTEIRGYPAGDDSSVRCVYLTNSATLVGFTLAQGATRSSFFAFLEREGGGVFCEGTSAIVSNCVFTANWAGLGGGAYSGTILNSTFTGNSAGRGGGAEASECYNCAFTGNAATGISGGGGAMTFGALTDCLVQGNSGAYGGGTYSCAATNCTFLENSAWNAGGGASYCTLAGCQIVANSAGHAGGVFDSTVFNSRFASNSAASTGGGANFGALYNCALVGNQANGQGGGASSATLNNCTVVGNSSAVGGGVNSCGLNNTLVYYNSAARGPNHYGSSANFSCTTPLPLGGIGNFIQEPSLTDSTHISSTSPCRAAGSAAYAISKDIDGQSWVNPPAIGCDEFYLGSVTGALSVAAQALHTNLAAGYAGGFTAQIVGRAAANRWEFGDGTVLSNRLSAAHAWAAPGSYAVIFRAYNDTYPAGVSATVTVQVVTQPIHYVAAGSATPVAPYNSWGTAAAKIQDAVDAATIAGALVLVTNGNYQTGGTIVSGALSNRVAITKPLVVRSVNGPTATLIQGYQVPGTTNGAEAVRCALLTSGAVLSGFTLTNGATRTDGDALLDQSGGGVRCELDAAVSNCVIVACAANIAGGGVSGGKVEWCTLTGNRSGGDGGAASESILTACRVSGNSAANAGGAIYSCEASGSILTNNAAVHGGGAYASTVRNSALAANNASVGGGGASASTLNNCTLTANTASIGGGTMDSTLHNCIAYYNTASREPNYSGGTLDFSCTTPLPAGIGNTTADPQLADFAHVSGTSPCRGAGSAAYASAPDLDGETWLAPPSIGCDEFYSGAITGALSVAVQTLQTNLATGFAVNFTATVNGHASVNRWNFGDGTILSNRLTPAHAWLGAGDYAVIFTAFNDSNPSGVSATVTVHVVSQPTHYVALGNATPVAPYLSWATAATNLQSAVDAASVAGAMVLVSNGVYSTGGQTVNGALTNRVAVTKPLLLQSVNGPAATVISGNGVIGPGAVRGVYLAAGAMLSGFTITNGAVLSSGDAARDMSGGGVWCESSGVVITNCVVAGNSAYNSGGGIHSGTLYDCSLFGNSAGGGSGGGAYLAALNNCVVRNNTARYGAGAHDSTLNQCQLLTNTASSGGGGADSSLLNRCTLIGNHGGNSGGGAQSSTLNNCLVFANATWEGGGGASSSTLANCTVVANSGGTAYCTVNNCIVYDNSGGNYYSSTLNYCCTDPLPDSGVGNIAAAPLFVNQAADDFHLQSISSCINAGHNASAAAAPDLDGNPRIVGGTVDLGAYESQTLPVQFLTAACRFNTNAAFQLTFTGPANGAYDVWASTNLVDWIWLGPAQPSAPGLFQFLDTAATNWPRRFYRTVAP